MKSNLLKKLFVMTALTAALSACDSSSDGEKFLNPVEVDGNILAVLDEDSGVHTFDLLEGVSNPENTVVYSRKFVYLKNDGADEPVDLFEGPPLPAAAVTKTSETMSINTELWKELLVHPETAAGNEDLFSQGKYLFTYQLDNGSSVLMERHITITINGVEDKVESITFTPPDTLSVPIGYPIPITAEVLPSNATFPELTWVSSNTGVATVDQDGVVTAVAYDATGSNTATISATSADGEVMATSVATVIPEPTEPLGVDILIDGKIATSVDLQMGTTQQLSWRTVPVDFEWDQTYTVEWTTADGEVVTVDEMGVLTPIMINEGTVDVTATLVELPSQNSSIAVQTTPNENLFFGNNHDFEDGAIGVYWNPASDNEGVIEVREEAAKDGMYGLYLDSRGGNKVKVISEQMAMRQIPVDPNKYYRFSFDIKNINGWWAGGPQIMFSNNNAKKSSYPKTGAGGNAGTWWGTASAEWTEFGMIYRGSELAADLDSEYWQVQFDLNSGQYYIDNMSFVEVDPADYPDS